MRTAAIALILMLLSGPARPSDVAFVTTTDFSSGSSSSINTATKASVNNVALIHSDATARYFDGLFYVVNRLGQDNIQRLNPAAGYATVNQFSTGNGSNPHDVAIVNATQCYVTRYESSELWEMNPATGAHTGTVSFAGLADADGIPEIDNLFLYRNLLFVSVQRLDRNNFFSPTASSDIAVVDVTTNTLVDTDPVTMGTQPITTVNPNPFSEIQLDPWSGRLYFSCVNFFGLLDGGVETIDPLTLQSTGVIFTETAAGGDILDVEVVSETIGYAIISTPSFVTDLISFNPQTGVKTATLYAPGDYVLQDIERSPFGGELFLSDRTVLNPGVRCYNSLTGAEITNGPINTGLPPFDITFSLPVQTGVGDTPAVSTLGPNYPNPFNPSTTIPWSLDRAGVVSLRIYNVSGGLVRTLVSGPVTAGARESTWDGRDDSGQPMASGMYFARLVTGTTTEVQKLTLIK